MSTLSSFFKFNSGVQKFNLVPSVTEYTITAIGGSGAKSLPHGSSGGGGAIVTTTYVPNIISNTLMIVVGGGGSCKNKNTSGDGGGLTQVLSCSDYFATIPDGKINIIAGGGGGGGNIKERNGGGAAKNGAGAGGVGFYAGGGGGDGVGATGSVGVGFGGGNGANYTTSGDSKNGSGSINGSIISSYGGCGGGTTGKGGFNSTGGFNGGGAANSGGGGGGAGFGGGAGGAGGSGGCDGGGGGGSLAFGTVNTTYSSSALNNTVNDVVDGSVLITWVSPPYISYPTLVSLYQVGQTTSYGANGKLGPLSIYSMLLETSPNHTCSVSCSGVSWITINNDYTSPNFGYLTISPPAIGYTGSFGLFKLNVTITDTVTNYSSSTDSEFTLLPIPTISYSNNNNYTYEVGQIFSNQVILGSFSITPSTVTPGCIVSCSGISWISVNSSDGTLTISPPANGYTGPTGPNLPLTVTIADTNNISPFSITINFTLLPGPTISYTTNIININDSNYYILSPTISTLSPRYTCRCYNIPDGWSDFFQNDDTGRLFINPQVSFNLPKILSAVVSAVVIDQNSIQSAPFKITVNINIPVPPNNNDSTSLLHNHCKINGANYSIDCKTVNIYNNIKPK